MPLKPDAQRAIDQMTNHLTGFLQAVKVLDERLEPLVIRGLKEYIEEREKPAPEPKAKSGGED